MTSLPKFSTEPNVKKEKVYPLPVEILRMDRQSIELYKQILTEGKEAVHTIRVNVVGQFNVGKTALTRRLLKKRVDIDKRYSTDGIEVHTRRCKVSLEDGEWTVLEQDDKSENTFKRLAKVIAQRELAKHSGGQSELNMPDDSIERESDIDGSHIKTHDITQKEDKTHTEQDKNPSVTTESDTDHHDTETNIPINEEIIIEHIKKVLQEANNIKATDSDYADLSIWDFAGQYAFYATHQVFLSNRAVYLLVTDISKPLYDVVEEDKCYLDSTGSKFCSISEFIEFWLNSIHEYCPSQEPGVPPVILVGTHADKLDQSKKEELSDQYFDGLRRLLMDNDSSIHLVDSDFAIDNAIEDPNLTKLKDKIFEVASKQQYWGELIPARWITLEQALVELRVKGIKICDKKTLLKINQALPVPLSSDEEIYLFLRFHHDSGNILYFGHKNISDNILLDPQWLVDAFKCLITANIFLKKKPEYIQWLEFDRTGKLEQELIDVVWKGTVFFDHRDHLLKLLEQLDIIARPRYFEANAMRTKIDDFYFAPCVLKDPPPTDFYHPNTSTTAISTSRLCFSMRNKALPVAMFNRLMAACLTQWPVSKQHGKYLIFCGCAVFDVDGLHTLTLLYSQNVIQIWVTKFAELEPHPNEDVCLEVRMFIEAVLANILKQLPAKSNLKKSFKCPKVTNVRSNLGMFDLKDFLNLDGVPCNYHGQPHLLSSADMLKYWNFEDDISEYPLPVEILRMDRQSIELYKQILTEGKEAVYAIRVMVVGQKDVGKTVLTRRLLGKHVDIHKRDSTNGIETHIRRCKISLKDGEWTVLEKDDKSENTLKRLAKLIALKKHSEEQQELNMLEDNTERESNMDGVSINTHDVKQKEDKTPTPVVDIDTIQPKVSDDLYTEQDNSTSMNPPVPTESDTDYQDIETNKPMNKDIIIEDIEEVIHEANKIKVKDSDYADLSIWDFAGQYEFYATHQVFMSRRAVYLLVTDISQPLQDLVIEDKCDLDRTGPKPCSISEFVEFWLNSIHEYSSNQEPNAPPVILVGTHADKLDQGKIKELSDQYFDDLRKKLIHKDSRLHLADKDFVINNTIKDPNLTQLKDKIYEVAKKQQYWGESLPAKWITLEKIIVDFRDKGVKICETKVLLKESQDQHVPLSSNEEFELFLRFHHESGNILYFSHKGLCDHILLDPQWLIDAFKCLITAKSFFDKGPEYKQWIEFDTTGKLKQELIDAVWKEKKFDAHQDHLLKLLEQLDIICRPLSLIADDMQTQIDYYFAPCVLKESPPPKIFQPNTSTSTSRLCFSMTEKALALPVSMFNRLMAACLSKWPLSKQDGEDLIYCGCAVFEVAHQHRLTLFFSQDVIQIWVTKSAKLKPDPDQHECLKVREFIEETLTTMRKQLPETRDLKMSFKCPNITNVRSKVGSKVGMFDLETILKFEEVTCSDHDTHHVLISADMLKYWNFEDVISDSVNGPKPRSTDDKDVPMCKEKKNQKDSLNPDLDTEEQYNAVPEEEGKTIWKKAIRKCYTKLVKEMDPTYILDHLFQLEFLSQHSKRDIEELPNRAGKNRAMIDKVLDKDEKGYNDFKKSLEEEGQQNLADYLTDHEN